MHAWEHGLCGLWFGASAGQAALVEALSAGHHHWGLASLCNQISISA
jgi:hypothetical protein